MKLIIQIIFISVFFVACTTPQTTNIIHPKEALVIKKDHNKEIFKSHIQMKKIAMIYSSKVIGKYAIDTSNAALGYLLSYNKPFVFELIDMDDESEESFLKAFNKLKQKGINNVLALVTNSSYDNLISVDLSNDFKIYLPLINTNNIKSIKQNIIYGGVDYIKQFKALQRYSNKKDIEFYDNSSFGKILNKQLLSVDQHILFTKELDDTSGFYGLYFNKNRKKINHSTLFIDTPIVKTSIILSQLRANDIELNKVLLTQINYTPLLLSLTQAKDRQNVVVANSIKPVWPQVRENISNLGGDIIFDWSIYATVVGIDYFYTKNNNIESNIINNQIQYDIKLYKAKYHSFSQIK